MEVNLTNMELFLNLVEIEAESLYVNLHNDFDCKSIGYLSGEKTFRLLFKAISDANTEVSEVELVFSNSDFTLMKIDFFNEVPFPKSVTVDTIYRGRYESQEGALSEKNALGKGYYYINFLEDLSFELFSDSVLAKLKMNTQ